MDVVGNIVGNVAGQPRNQVPVLNRIAGYGSRHTQRVAAEVAAGIHLGRGCLLNVVITPAGHEMLFGRKIVVYARHGDFAGRWETQVAREP